MEDQNYIPSRRRNFSLRDISRPVMVTMMTVYPLIQWIFSTELKSPRLETLPAPPTRADMRICGGQSGTAGGFLQLLLCLLTISIPATAPHSSIICYVTLYILDNNSIIK
jgi:hypothetical protein